MSESFGPIRALTCIRKAYSGGVVPSADYPALLGLLRERLPADDVVGVATELVVRGVSFLTGADLRDDVLRTASARVPSVDLRRVAGLLREGGWDVDESPNPGAA